MKRDMNVIRQILLDIEAADFATGFNASHLSHWDHDSTNYNLGLAIQAGLVTAISEAETRGGYEPVGP